jgi:hypothetical protein
MTQQTKDSVRATAAAPRFSAIAVHELRIPWVHLLALATQIEQEAAATGSPTTETTLRLARGILRFQHQMLGRQEHRSG